MTQSHTRIAADYNRTLAAPVRWVHVGWAVVRDLFGPLTDWAMAPSRRLWAPPALWACALAAVLIPVDGRVSRWAAGLSIGGDLRREMETLQQYGDAGTTAIVVIVIWLLDASRRRRVLDLLAAVVVTGVVVSGMKMLIGRPRPQFDDPLYFLGPFASYPIGRDVGVRHAWEFWAGISSKLWSMPSSHTAFAVVLSVFLCSLYPRLKPLTIAMPILVGVCRVLFRSHFPSDVVVGALVALAAARPAIEGAWGQRVVARLAGRPSSGGSHTG